MIQAEGIKLLAAMHPKKLPVAGSCGINLIAPKALAIKTRAFED